MGSGIGTLDCNCCSWEVHASSLYSLYIPRFTQSPFNGLAWTLRRRTRSSHSQCHRLHHHHLCRCHWLCWQAISRWRSQGDGCECGVFGKWCFWHGQFSGELKDGSQESWLRRVEGRFSGELKDVSQESWSAVVYAGVEKQTQSTQKRACDNPFWLQRWVFLQARFLFSAQSFQGERIATEKRSKFVCFLNVPFWNFL